MRDGVEVGVVEGVAVGDKVAIKDMLSERELGEGGSDGELVGDGEEVAIAEGIVVGDELTLNELVGERVHVGETVLLVDNRLLVLEKLHAVQFESSKAPALGLHVRPAGHRTIAVEFGQ